MGSALSRIAKEGHDNSFVATPKKLPPKLPSEADLMDDVNNDAEIDPRSPHFCRTPLNDIVKAKYFMTKNQNLTEAGSLTEAASDSSPSKVLTQRLMKGFGQNLLDPRSPSVFINRTPLRFDEESDLPIYVEVDNEVAAGDQTDASLIGVFEKPFTIEQPETPKAEGEANVRDPRSPTEGLERTPIIFSEEIVENEIESFEELMDKLGTVEIQNKQLERVKNPRSRLPQRATRSSRTIYEDKPAQAAISTPKRATEDSSNTPKRTPLGCVANKTHLRSKSVEGSAKSLSNKMRVSSYDDYSLKEKRQFSGSGESPQIMTIRRLNV